jgi:hypothetical protein
LAVALLATMLGAWLAGYRDDPHGYESAACCRAIVIFFCLVGIITVANGDLSSPEWRRNLPYALILSYAGVLVLALSLPGSKFWTVHGYHRRVCRTLDPAETVAWARTLRAHDMGVVKDTANMPESVRSLMGEHPGEYSLGYVGTDPECPGLEIRHSHFCVLVATPADGHHDHEPAYPDEVACAPNVCVRVEAILFHGPGGTLP